MKKENEIEKAKQNVGDIHPNGKWVWTEYAPGKFDWRAIKGKGKNTNSPHQTASNSTPAKIATAEQTTASPSSPTAAPTPAPAPKKQEVPYDAPKPKIQYKNNSKDLFKVEYRVPETWTVKLSDGTLKLQERSKVRAALANKNTHDDDKILSFINKVGGNSYVKQLAWEEAAARGIPENKIKYEGLKAIWRQNAAKYELEHPDKQDEDEFGTIYNNALGNFDVESFKQKFPEGDMGWLNPDDTRVQKAFNNLQNLRNRQQYDAVVDVLKREDSNYFTPEDQLAALRIGFNGFVKKPYTRGTAIFVSTGGAGAGKTYSLKQVLEQNGLTLYDPDIHSDPHADDINAIMVPDEIEDVKDFNRLLGEFNGKTLIFDDKDKLLTSRSGPILSAMKNIGDSEPNNRIFKNPKTGKSEKFKGKLIFITNKTFDKLNNNPDTKAIFSRVEKNDIQLTLNENLELLGDRYMTMNSGKYSDVLTPQQEKELRQDVYAFILDNVDKIDPFKFTVRKFTELMDKAIEVIEADEQSKINANFNDMFGGNGSKASNWRRIALRELNKGIETDIEKSGIEVFENLTKEDLADYKKEYKKNPKKFRELFGEKFIKYLTGEEGGEDVVEEDEEEVIKGIVDDFGKISIEEAQNILFQ